MLWLLIPDPPTKNTMQSSSILKANHCNSVYSKTWPELHVHWRERGSTILLPRPGLSCTGFPSELEPVSRFLSSRSGTQSGNATAYLSSVFSITKDGSYGAPRVFSWRLKISIIWGIIKTEDLKTKFFKIWRTEDIIILSFVTIETCCLRLKIWRHHTLNMKIQNLVLCAGSPGYTWFNCDNKQKTIFYVQWLEIIVLNNLSKIVKIVKYNKRLINIQS